MISADLFRSLMPTVSSRQRSDVSLTRQFLSDRLFRDESVVLIAEDRPVIVVGFVQL
jgi:hypothetical protein